jgi:hypothetical protein
MLDAAANLECSPTVSNKRDCHTRRPANFVQSASVSGIPPDMGVILNSVGHPFSCVSSEKYLSVVLAF